MEFDITVKISLNLNLYRKILNEIKPSLKEKKNAYVS